MPARTRLRALLVAAAALLAVLAATWLPTSAAQAAPVLPAQAPVGQVAQMCPPDDPCPKPSCTFTGCVGVWPQNTNCDDNATTISKKYVALYNGAELDVRGSSFCRSRWVRVVFGSYTDCAMTGIEIQPRTKSGGVWHNGAIQKVTKGFSAQCTNYWTRMTAGDQVRVRVADGHVTPSCGSTCVTYDWQAWGAWVG